MRVAQQDYAEFAEMIATAVVETLEKRGLVGNSPPPSVGNVQANTKSAYQKTEQLLFNYCGFKRIVEEKQQEIVEIRKYGVPRSCAVHEFVRDGNVPHGLVLEEESVEAAVANVERSVRGTVAAIALIDKCMAALKHDPYYPILEMRYFEGRTMEDIAVVLKCAQSTASQNKARLVKELSLRLFPDQAISEMMQ